MNPVLMIAFNNLALTKQAVASVLAQDIPVELHFVDNGSIDGTWEWASEQGFASCQHNPVNRSPVAIGNTLAASIFSRRSHLLGVPNDAILPANCYSELLKWPRGFVCATDIGQNTPECRPGKAVSENTPLAVMLTRKWAYDALIARDGYFFDENIFMYASDCDLALRMATCGIRGIQLDVPFWHYGSASHRLALPHISREITAQADRDRDYFEKKWGFKVDSLEYGQRPADINFKG